MYINEFGPVVGRALHKAAKGESLMEYVTVVAVIRAKRGMESKVREELLNLLQLSRSDDGCVNYDLHQGIDDPALFVFHENWQSKELLDKHLATAHVQNFLSKAQDLLAEPVDLKLLNRIG
jgi:quinol monooxygenase YgiN